jgi:pimeloyl-ACP methyl ester carboxylesterase
VVGGLVLVIVGGGLGVPHAVREGATPTAVLGVLALGVGLVLLVTGLRRTVAGMAARRRWLTTGALVLVSLVAVATFAPAVMATHPPHASIRATPADRGLTAEPVVLETTSGVRLAAWYLPSRNGAAVVLRHGAGSTRSSVLEEAAVLADNGYGVLLTDARGQGESEGRAMAFGWYGEEDIAAALDHLATRPEVDPDRLGVVGLSMGGEEALGALGVDDRIAAVVAEGATGRSDLDKAWLSDAFGVRGWAQEQLEHLQYAAVAALTPAARPMALMEAVAGSDAPVLLIAAGQVDDEGRVAEVLRSARPDGVEVWVVAGAGHTQGLATDPRAWEDRVIGVLDGALLG